MKDELKAYPSPKQGTHPLGPGTTNMAVNVKETFKTACFEAACDARMKLSDWMRAAFEEKLARQKTGKKKAAKLEAVA